MDLVLWISPKCGQGEVQKTENFANIILTWPPRYRLVNLGTGKNHLSISQTPLICSQATPGAGAYFNEADTFEANWQEQFWGTDNYNALLSRDTFF